MYRLITHFLHLADLRISLKCDHVIMKKLTNNRTIVIICLVVLTYCLAVPVEKRITPNDGFQFKLWSPYYLLFAITIPPVILLPVKFLPTGRYANYILRNEKGISKEIVISTLVILVWFALWYAMIAMGNSMDRAFDAS